MNRWWRAYDECVDDEKLLLLSDKLHRAWFNLLCLSSKNNGRLPAMEVMCLKLRMPQAKVVAIIEELKDRKLLDEYDDGIGPHNWNGRQYKSDVSTERVKRFRNAKQTVSETHQSTETETETDKERVLVASRPTSDDWEQIKRSYPRRKGANPWKPAKAAYVAACRRNPENHSRMLSALRAGVGFDRDKIGTEFIPRASTWFREERWADHNPVATGPPRPPQSDLPSDQTLREKYGQQLSIVHTETDASHENGIGTDHGGELRREGAEIRPVLRRI